MAVTVYAVPNDLVDWLGEVPDDAVSLIRSASLLVSKKTRFDRYEHDDATGAPTDPKIVDAFRDATCQQVALYKAAGLNPTGGVLGMAARVSSQSVDGASIGYTHISTAEHAAQAIKELGDEALTILQLAGLTFGDVDFL